MKKGGGVRSTPPSPLRGEDHCPSQNGAQVLRTCPDCNVDQETQNENIVQKPRTNVRNERVIFPD